MLPLRNHLLRDCDHPGVLAKPPEWHHRNGLHGIDFFCDSEHAAGVCLGTLQARTHVQLALGCQRSMLCAQHRLRLTMQHVYGHTGNLGNECAIMPLHLVHLASFPATTLPLAGFVITLTHLPVVMVVTASARFWKECVAIETEATSLPQDGS